MRASRATRPVSRVAGAEKKRAHLYDARTSACSHDGGGRAHVEQVVPVAACANNVDDEIAVCILHIGFEGPLAEDRCSGC